MQPKWHKLPPVPGWYVVAQMAGGKVVGCGCAYYSKRIISGLYEENEGKLYIDLCGWEVSEPLDKFANDCYWAGGIPQHTSPMYL